MIARRGRKTNTLVLSVIAIVLTCVALIPIVLAPSYEKVEISTAAPEVILMNDTDFEQYSEEELKNYYIACNRIGGKLDSTMSVRACSQAYENLINRYFNGDFEKFLEWSRANN